MSRSPALRSRSPMAALRKLLFRVHVVLWVALSLGVLLAIAFGEIGLNISLFLYASAVVLTGVLVLRECGYFKQPRRIYGGTATVTLLFSSDAAAAGALMLGIVMQAASPHYGYVYDQIGFILILMAGTAWTASFISALITFFRTGNSVVIAFVCCYLWIGVISAYAILAGGGFSGR